MSSNPVNPQALAKTMQVPTWHVGVPDEFKGNPNYFRNHIVENWILQITPGKGEFAQFQIDVVDKMQKPGKNGLRFPVQIITPPYHFRYPNLDKTGNFPAEPKVTLESAKFTVQIIEGNINDKTVNYFPSLPAEIEAHMDWEEMVYDYVLRLMYSDDRIRGKQKSDARNSILKHVPKDKKEDPEYMAEIERELFEEFKNKANSDGEGKKSDYVRKSETSGNRYILLKRAVSRKVKDKKDIPNNYPEFPSDKEHFINKLWNGKDKRLYTPPTIKLPNGANIDLISKKNGKINWNEIPVVGAGDVGFAQKMIKISDSGQGYMVGHTLVFLQLIRKAREDEKTGAGTDVSRLGEVYDPFEGQNKQENEEPTKKKQKTSDENEDKNNSKKSQKSSSKRKPSEQKEKNKPVQKKLKEKSPEPEIEEESEEEKKESSKKRKAAEQKEKSKTSKKKLSEKNTEPEVEEEEESDNEEKRKEEDESQTSDHEERDD